MKTANWIASIGIALFLMAFTIWAFVATEQELNRIEIVRFSTEKGHVMDCEMPIDHSAPFIRCHMVTPQNAVK